MKKLSALIAGVMLITMSGNLAAQTPAAVQAGRRSAVSDSAIVAGVGLAISAIAVIILWYDHHSEQGHAHSH